MSDINAESITVFISYSHDSPAHLERVLKLSDRLRRDGIDCLIDQYEMSPREGWPRWTMSQIEEARFVLVVCTDTYHRRVRGKEESGKGRGAKWEGAIITQELYDSEATNDKFIPVLFSSEDSVHVPVYLRSVTRYVLDDDYEDLYRRLSNQPKRLKPALGTRRALPPLDRKEDFLPVPESRASRQPAGVGGTMPAADSLLNPSPHTEQPSKAISDKKPNPPADVRSRRRASWIFGALGFAAFVFILLWWFSPLAPVKSILDLPKKTDPDPIAIYRVRVTVLDLQQVPVNDAEVYSSAGGEWKKVAGGGEFDIPAASKPEDGKVTLYASKPGASLHGQEDLVLNTDSNPAIKIQLRQGAPPNLPNHGGDGSLVKPASIAIYRVRVSVLDSEQTLVEEAEVRPLPGGEVKKVAGGWEIDIPAVNKPADGTLKIYVAKPSAFLKGEASLRLDKDPNPTVEIHLRRDTTAHVKGKVIDSSSQALVGAWVNVVGFERERVKTGSGGEFDLPAHAAEGQSVRLHAEMEGYTPEDQHHLAGSHPATLILRRR
jgi:hypothetical protein